MIRNKELIYKLIYQVLIEIREEAHSKENKKVFYLSDLVHNIPLRLLKVNDEADFDKILSDITKNAEARGMGSWLNNTLSQL